MSTPAAATGSSTSGEAGKQLFREYPLSGQLVVARAYDREGGKAAGKGKPKTGKAAKGMAKTGKAAKGAAHWNAGVMQTPQELLLAFQQ